jgi:hypothetical protein
MRSLKKEGNWMFTHILYYLYHGFDIGGYTYLKIEYRERRVC